MNSFSERKIEDFNNDISKIFNLMSVNGKYAVIGSSALRKIKYNSDFDLDELEKFKSASKSVLYNVWKMFCEKFKIAKADKTIFITDFKCGEDETGEALRWNINNLINGYQSIKGKRYYFINCLLQKATIKLDVIAYINGAFVEYSDNYFFKFGKEGNFNFSDLTKDNILESIKDSYNEEINDKNYYKALKRSFAYKLMKGTKKMSVLEKLTDFFNSDVGILNKAKADINVLILLLEQEFRKPEINDIKNNLQIIKQNLSYNIQYDIGNVSRRIDDICRVSNVLEIKKRLENLSTDISDIVNKAGLNYLKKNKNLII
jgi:hypothetical protein